MSIIKAYLQGIIASLDPHLVLNKSWFTCYCRRRQKFMASHDFRKKCKKWEGMGQTCLRSPCCPGTLFPGCSHPSLAGVARLAPILMMPILCRKQLILETALMRPLDRVASMAVLTATGVENVFKFDRAKAPALRAGQTRVYLISANLIMAKLVADQVSEAATGSNDKVMRHR